MKKLMIVGSVNGVENGVEGFELLRCARDEADLPAACPPDVVVSYDALDPDGYLSARLGAPVVLPVRPYNYVYLYFSTCVSSDELWAVYETMMPAAVSVPLAS